MVDNDHDKHFTDWLRFWTTPLGVFVVVVSLALAGFIYNSLQFQEQIHERRLEFCLSENSEAQKVRLLWEGVIVQSQQNTVIGTVSIEGRTYDVKRAKTNPAQLTRFRSLVAEVYPLRNCKEF